MIPSPRAIDWLALARAQAARFWSKVEKADRAVRADLGPCWEWAAGKDKDGYGKFAITAPTGHRPKQRHVRAHRLALEMSMGSVDPSLVTIHLCDNPACVNPSHLRAGTQAENRADCGIKDRNPKGERNGARARCTTILSPDVVASIRASAVAGESGAAIAKRLGLNPMTVRAVIARRTWRWCA